LKRQFLGYAIITLFALILRLFAYDYALPFLAHVDEPLFYLWCNDTRGILENQNNFMQQYQRVYPPGYLWLCAGAMNAVDAVWHWNPYIDIGAYTGLMRLISAFADTATGVVIMALLHRLSGYGAAVLGGLLWAFSAPIINENILMTPNAVLLLLCALCTYTLALAVLDERARWIWVSTCCAIAAVVFKFSVFLILLLPAFSVLWLMWRWRWRALPHAAGALIIVCIFALWLVFGFGAFEILELSPGEAGQIRETGNLLMPARYSLIFASLAYTFGFFSTTVVVLTLIVNLKRWLPLRNWSRQALMTGVIGFIGLLLLIVTVLYVRNQHVRLFNYVVTVRYISPAAVLVLVAGCAWIGKTFFEAQRSRWRWLIVLLWLGSVVPAALTNAAAYERPDTRLLTQQWLLANVPIGNCVWTDNYDLGRTLSIGNGGGDVAQLLDKDLMMLTLEQVELGQSACNYVILSGNESTYLQPPLPLTALHHIGGDGVNGIDVYISTPTLISQPHDMRLSSSDAVLRLRGLAGERDNDVVRALTFWQAEMLPRVDLSYFLYLTYPQNQEQVLAIISGPLGNRLTASWSNPSELHMFRTAPLTIPPLETGEYAVYLGVYNPQTGERLALENGETTIEVLRWSVES
jgi:4-amino-4-deoxy-L-arabinose transferase-like glycosyltransferase